LVNGKRTLRTASIVREGINDGTLKFNSKDYKWYFASGGEFVEPLLTLKLQDVVHKEELLIEAALLDATLKGAIFSALGRRDYDSVDELREFTKQTLMSMVSRYGLKCEPTDTTEKLVEKICLHIGVEYKPRNSA